MERTLIILKPDALQRGLAGEIIKRLESKGLKLIGAKMMRLDSALLQAHYAHLIDKPFYAGIEEFMQSSPVVVMAWEGFECVNSVRVIVGATNPRQADAGTIRGDLAIGQGRNLIHASDSKESGEKEINRFFNKNEIFEYDKSEYLHIYESYERQ
jgi:nucleoside-diphosphate kinase